MKKLTEAQRAAGIARENAMHWAMQTATLGEDAMAILARAQIYEDYILAETAESRLRSGVSRDLLQRDVH